MGDLQSESPCYGAMATQNLSEPDQQTRNGGLELLARPRGSQALVQALDQAGEEGRLPPC